MKQQQREMGRKEGQEASTHFSPQPGLGREGERKIRSEHLPCARHCGIGLILTVTQLVAVTVPVLSRGSQDQRGEITCPSHPAHS